MNTIPVKALPIINLTRCSRCGLCMEACPEGALVLDPVSGHIFADEKKCTYCTTCEEICPEQAISCPLVIIWEEK